MIDLHCHILPSIDDGASNLEVALGMARIAVDDGIRMTACTPHIYPGLYENTADQIRAQVERFRADLLEAQIPLELTYGADIQLVPEMLSGLRAGTMPTLHGTRYFLFEPPHHTVPTQFAHQIFDLLAASYVPVITHPERLTWLDDKHFGWFVEAARGGAWIQVTAGAVTGRFGRRPKYWAERFLGDGLVHILATDAHETKYRPPLLAEAHVAAQKWLDGEEADLLVKGRPQAIIQDLDPALVTPPPGLSEDRRRSGALKPKRGWLARTLFGS